MRTAVAGKEPNDRHECLSCGSRLTNIRGRVVTCQKCWTVYYMPPFELASRLKGSRHD